MSAVTYGGVSGVVKYWLNIDKIQVNLGMGDVPQAQLSPSFPEDLNTFYICQGNVEAEVITHDYY